MESVCSKEEKRTVRPPSMYSRLYGTICELDGILLKYFVVFLHLIFYCQPMDKLT
ncbi:unnamed protein product [Prunus brigantina]